MPVTRPALPTALLGALAIALSLLLPSGSQAAVTGDNPCSTQPQYSWYGDSIGTSQAIPSTTVDGLTFPSTVLRPADTVAFPGKRPVIIIQHGRNGNRCSLWWVAQFLAGHGYVAEVHAAPSSPQQDTAFYNAVDATRAAFAFMNSPDNPAAGVSDLDRFGLTGHSLGSAVTSLLQGDASLGIDAVIASDNLRRYMLGDRGGSNDECDQPPDVEVTPTVPALGFAKDEPCNSAPTVTDPDIKQYAWSWWRSKAMPSVELVMRGFVHGDFSGGGEETKKHDLSHWYEAWFDHWLLGEPADRILATEVNGRPTSEILSSQYLSAACLPGMADTPDLSTWLTSGSPKPQPMGACDPVAVPTSLTAASGSPGSSTTVRIKGKADAGADIRLFRTPGCTGDPVGQGKGALLASYGIPVTVPKGSVTTFRAVATNPVNGKVSPCSASSVTYRQQDPRTVILSLTGPRKVRAGRSVTLKLRLRNNAMVVAPGLVVNIRSGNRRVKVPSRIRIGTIGAKTYKTIRFKVKARPAAKGKARIRIAIAGKTRTRVLRVAPRR